GLGALELHVEVAAEQAAAQLEANEGAQIGLRDARRGFAVVTSRCSLELIHKAVRAGFASLVSLSAPTDLCVRWARRHRLNLIHLPHHSPPRVYSPAP
ncbi:formate dehydrogenase accessory sulfurtransferase FdhD, partial [Ectopseudomonas hydrolytica]|uniref:formate dehydrogenase accessory sulfurtransferase FdhD n=1 Tax=Ectopseudomonas hydrolytica TaxID=2493633 RepID=UPI003C2AE9C0